MTEGRRWHDNRGELSRLVELLDTIPTELRYWIAEALTGKTNKEFNAAEILTSLKSLGKDKIMALHQAGKKRRSYDQDPNLHQIVNTFFVLPEDAQENTAELLLAFTDLMVEYMANCDVFDLEPNPEEMVQMRNLFVEEGPSAVQSYLSEIHQPYYNVMAGGSESTQAGNLVVQDAEGLLIRKKSPDT